MGHKTFSLPKIPQQTGKYYYNFKNSEWYSIRTVTKQDWLKLNRPKKMWFCSNFR